MSNLARNCSYLLSYPRSGNTWIRFAIEMITGFKTGDPHGKLPIDKSALDPVGLKSLATKKDRYILIKRHSFDGSENNKLGLIVPVRHYLEAIPRHQSHEPHRGYRFQDSIKQRRGFNPVSYTQILKEFDNWIEKRTMVYYEDLILNPVDELCKILIFLGVFQEYEEELRTFSENILEYKRISVDTYSRKISKSVTKGESTVFHRNKIPEDQQQDWVEQIEKADPDLFFKYLSHYDL